MVDAHVIDPSTPSARELVTPAAHRETAYQADRGIADADHPVADDGAQRLGGQAGRVR